MTNNLSALQQYMGGTVAAPAPTPTLTPEPTPEPTPAPAPETATGVNGTDGNDTLQGTSGVDNMLGRNGNDRLMGSASGDRLDGGAGTDLADYSKSGWVDVDLTRSIQNGGLAGGDTLVSIEGIVGTDQNDWLAGDAGANQLFGGGGADDLNGRGGADLLDGSWWIDTANYRDSDVGVNVDLLRATQIGGHAEGDILRGIENLSGSNHADTLSGDGGANVIAGQAGDDVIEGRGGSDVLTGGQGNDRFVFGSVEDSAGDRITDFGSGDLIDLRNIDANVHASGNQGFNFLGFGNFTKSAGQLKQVWSGNGSSYLQGDTNGDGTADFSILVDGNFEFRHADLLL